MKNLGVYFRAKHCGPKLPQILNFKSNGGKFWPKCSKIRVKRSFFSLAMLPQCCTPPNPSRVLVSCGCVEHTPQPNWGVAFLRNGVVGSKSGVKMFVFFTIFSIKLCTSFIPPTRLCWDAYTSVRVPYTTQVGCWIFFTKQGCVTLGTPPLHPSPAARLVEGNGKK